MKSTSVSQSAARLNRPGSGRALSALHTVAGPSPKSCSSPGTENATAETDGLQAAARPTLIGGGKNGPPACGGVSDLGWARWNGRSPATTQTMLATGWPSWIAGTTSTSATVPRFIRVRGSSPRRAALSGSAARSNALSVNGPSCPETYELCGPVRCGTSTPCRPGCAGATVWGRGPGAGSASRRGISGSPWPASRYCRSIWGKAISRASLRGLITTSSLSERSASRSIS